MFLYILTKFRNIAYKMLQAIGPLQLDSVAWFARGSCMQPARLGQRPTLVNTQGPIKLRCDCYVTVAGQCAAAASQLAVIDLLPAVAPTNLRSRQQKSAGPICTHCWKNVIIFVNLMHFPYIACCLFLLPDYSSLPWKNQLHWSHLSQYQNAEYTNNSKMSRTALDQ